MIAIVLPGTAALAQAPVANAAASSNQATVSLNTPEMLGLLSFDPAPNEIDVVALGKWYIDGVLSGTSLVQDVPAAGDRSAVADIGNGQIIVQKIDGLLQFYVQAGTYSIAALGTRYAHLTDSGTELHALYGLLPQAFIKIAPGENVSVVAGKLPSLIGAEDSFTFQNFNIERGLLWNQAPAVSRGLQANYTAGKATLSLSLNDGFYANRYSVVSGSATWTFDTNDSLVLAAQGNTAATKVASIATPLAQNNSTIIDLIYLAVAKPVTLTSYLQYANVPKNTEIGILHGASSYGAALLASVSAGQHWGVAGRVEYLGTTGDASERNATNLLYGAGSGAVSATLTPTYAERHFFARAEASLVQIIELVGNDGFGRDGRDASQIRGVLEVGVIF